MRKISPVFIAFLAASCSPPANVADGPGTAENVASESVRGEPVKSLSDIEGYWYIARFEDFRPGWRTSGAWKASYVYIDDGNLSYAVGCNHSGNPAKIKDGILIDTGNGDRMQTLMGCGSEIEARDGRFYSFFSAKPAIVKLGEGKLRLDNGTAQLILLSPERYLAELGADLDEVAGRWVPQYAEQYSGRGMSGASIGDDPGVMTITASRMSWSKCPVAEVRGEYSSGHRFIAETEPSGDCAPQGLQIGAQGNIVTRIMRSNPGFVRLREDTIVMYNDDEALHLVSEESILNPPPPPPAPPGLPPPPPPPPPPPQ